MDGAWGVFDLRSNSRHPLFLGKGRKAVRSDSTWKTVRGGCAGRFRAGILSVFASGEGLLLSTTTPLARLRSLLKFPSVETVTCAGASRNDSTTKEWLW